MSTQIPPILLGPRSGTGQIHGSESDLQQALGKIFEILSRRRWLFILPMLSGALIVLIGGLLIPRQYVATASFERSDDMVISSLVQASTPFSFASLREAVPVDLLGYNAVARCVDQLGLLDDLPRNETGKLTPEAEYQKRKFVGRLSSQFSYKITQNGKRQDMIQLRYEGDKPELGEQFLTRLMDNYITLMQSRISDVLDQSYEFFRKEAASRKKRVARLMWEQIQFGLENPGVMPTDPDVLDRRVDAERLALEEVAKRIEDTASRIAVQREYLAGLSDKTSDGNAPPAQPSGDDSDMKENPRWQKLHLEVVQFEEKIADLRATRGMTDLHPEIVGLINKIDLRKREMERLPRWIAEAERRQIQQDPQAAWDAETQRVENDLKVLRQELAGLEEQKNGHETAIREIEESKRHLYERREQFITMDQELQNARKDLEVWNKNAERLEQVLVVTSQDRGIKFSVVSESRSGVTPEYPTQLGVYSMAGGVGIALGALVIFLRELFDRSFRHPARVRQTLGIPVLETIGEIQVRRVRRWLDRQRVLPAVAMVESVAIMAVCFLVHVSLQEPAAYERMIGSLKLLWPL